MLNYIWTGLIVASLGFALFYDLGDWASDKYRNGQPLAVSVTPDEGADTTATSFAASASISPDVYSQHYGLDAADEIALLDRYPVTLTKLATDPGYELRFDSLDGVPELLLAVAKAPDPDDPALVAVVPVETWAVGKTYETELTQMAEVRFLKVQAITQAAFSMAKTAVMGIALPLIGVLALWLGIVKIAEAGGLVNVLVKVIQPVLHPLFPEIPRDHPAIGMIALNLAANVLGLGNAATPMGIKAMEEMQKLNPEKDTATNGMCTFLAINTASVQLLPPATLVAVMGIATGQLWLPILAVTGLSLIIGIVAARSLQRLPVFVRSNPMRNGPAPDPGNTSEPGDESTGAEKGGDA